MSSEPKNSQSISISSSTLNNTPIAQAGNNVNQSQQVGQSNLSEQLQPADVVELLEQLTEILSNSSLPNEQKNRAMRGIETAKDEATEEEPDKEYAGKGLERAAKVLKTANEALGEGTNLWEKAEPILKKLLPYFGVALSILV